MSGAFCFKLSALRRYTSQITTLTTNAGDLLFSCVAPARITHLRNPAFERGHKFRVVGHVVLPHRINRCKKHGDITYSQVIASLFQP